MIIKIPSIKIDPKNKNCDPTINSWKSDPPQILSPMDHASVSLISPGRIVRQTTDIPGNHKKFHYISPKD